MATYSPSSLNIAPPPGGFQQGGWYSGRQYWGGTLSDPGVIHPSSDQIGAGQAVSADVNRQTSIAAGLAPDANQRYVEQQRAQQPAITYANDAFPTYAQRQATGNLGAIPGGGSTGPTKPLVTPLVDTLNIAAKPAPAIDLPNLYKSLQAGSGITEAEAQLSALTKAHNDAMSKINDNPWLSEATRVGRISKLATDYENKANAIKGDIAVKKADIETLLNLQTKQFDIQSNQAQQAMSQYNTLLNSGALNNASGEDIAAITRATGLSSSMIYGAINNKKINDVKTSTVSFDDGTNQGFAVINSQTGEIISRQIVAASKPDTSNIQFDNGTNQGFATVDNRTGQIINTQNISASKPAAVTQASKEAVAKSAVGQMVNIYRDTNPQSPTYQQGKVVRSSYSPQDFYKQLIIDYPDAEAYIKAAFPEGAPAKTNPTSVNITY